MFNPRNVAVASTHTMPEWTKLQERKATLKEGDSTFRDRLCEDFAADGNQRIGRAVQGASRRNLLWASI